MSMYSELLGISIAAQDADDPSAATAGALLARAIGCRRSLPSDKQTDNGAPARRKTVTGEMAGDLAANLDYDAALVRLCAARGIRATVEGFATPRDERRRLEEALKAAGVDLSTMGDHVAGERDLRP